MNLIPVDAQVEMDVDHPTPIRLKLIPGENGEVDVAVVDGRGEVIPLGYIMGIWPDGQVRTYGGLNDFLPFQRSGVEPGSSIKVVESSWGGTK